MVVRGRPDAKGHELHLAGVQIALANPFKPCPSSKSWRRAAEKAAYDHWIPVEWILDGRGEMRVRKARWDAWSYLLAENPGYSLAGIGRLTGWDRTTIAAAMKRRAIPVNSTEPSIASVIVQA